MPERTLIARIRPDAEAPESGRLVVASPVVAVAERPVATGTYLNPLDRVATLRILNERYVLRLPRDVQGRVVAVFVERARAALAYDDALVRLDPAAWPASSGVEANAAGAADAGEPQGGRGGAGSGGIVVAAPSEGIFYLRPSPGASPYVTVGAAVSTGSVLGLVEVMKCFQPIAYGGPGLPEAGEVARILVEDATEVRFGQPLFEIRPAG